MSQRRRFEYTCEWCARLQSGVPARVQIYKRWSWITLWRICDDCMDRLFELRGRETYGTIEQSRALRLQHEWIF